MCHDWWMRRESRREERFDEELERLLDEREHPEPPLPTAADEPEEQPAAPERHEVGTRA